MGGEASRPDEHGAYAPPDLDATQPHSIWPDEHEASSLHSSMIAVMAAIRLQKVFRGRRARRGFFTRGLHTLVQGIDSCKVGAKRAVLSSSLSALLTKIDETLYECYATALKYRISPCPAMPSIVREALHSTGDYAWQQAHDSLMASLTKRLTDRFGTPQPESTFSGGTPGAHAGDSDHRRGAAGTGSQRVNEFIEPAASSDDHRHRKQATSTCWVHFHSVHL